MQPETETVETEPETQPQGGSEEPAVEPEQTPEQREISRLKKENAERRIAAKELAEKAKKYDELEAAKKPELERIGGELAEATKAREAAEQRAMRLEVAMSVGLPIEAIPRLQGSTIEELTTDAEEFMAMMSGKKGSDVSQGLPGRPTPALRPGGNAGAPPEETNPAKLAAQIPRGY